MRAPSYTRFHWAKSEPRQGHPKAVHLLEHHLADVGACFEALLAQPRIRENLASSAGLNAVDETTASRLALFAALHDIGKVNMGFQMRIWDPRYLSSGHRVRYAGHTLDLAPVLSGEDVETAGWFFDELGWWDEALTWDDCGGETVCSLLVATLSHHGFPLQLEGSRPPNPVIWRSHNGLDPAACLRRIGSLVRGWFEDAWNAGAPPLPSNPEFQHIFLGLCTLADWIGSNREWFPFCAEPDDRYIDIARRRADRAVSMVGLDISGQRASVRGRPWEFAQLFDFSPTSMQERAGHNVLPDERLVVIESETGSGKTEAALWRFANMYDQHLVDGLYFALPTRAAATQLHGRVTRFVERMLPEEHRPEVVLAVPGYLKAGDIGGRHLPEYEVHWDDHPDGDARGRRWAAENAKRYLAAQIAVGTVDQAMLSALKVGHAHMRAACLARNLLVVDEVHASDTYMRRILRTLLDGHLGAGGYALLMSATLGFEARREWLSAGRPGAEASISLDEAIRSPYPAMSTTASGGKLVGQGAKEKRVRISAENLMHDMGSVSGKALEAARAGAKVLVIRNTVDYAVRTQKAVECEARGPDSGLLFRYRSTPTLHHGRFVAADRRLLDQEVAERLGRDRDAGGLVVVGTQTLEQSLDIDADLLITDLCPADVLLQRIGRLHRHFRTDRPKGYGQPRCVVLTPPQGDLSHLLQRGHNPNGLGPYGHVYEDLRVLEATRRLIQEPGVWTIPEMNRELVERATHREVLQRIVEELGEEWRAHANQIRGEQLADGLTAGNALVRRNRSFHAGNREVLFGSLEVRIRTRLGDEGIEVEFTPPPFSPFPPGDAIGSISVPARWLSGVNVDGPVAPEIDDEGFTFGIGDHAFRYDRLGLRRT
ncbi:MAG: CRISPR-associated helicase Cas3' [Dehalococcoidia bacterium]|nr:CRISPR-associated helicase Cas3' [Dehalococcoidia bacterium]